MCTFRISSVRPSVGVMFHLVSYPTQRLFEPPRSRSRRNATTNNTLTLEEQQSTIDISLMHTTQPTSSISGIHTKMKVVALLVFVGVSSFTAEAAPRKRLRAVRHSSTTESKHKAAAKRKVANKDLGLEEDVKFWTNMKRDLQQFSLPPVSSDCDT